MRDGLTQPRWPALPIFSDDRYQRDDRRDHREQRRVHAREILVADAVFAHGHDRERQHVGWLAEDHADDQEPEDEVAERLAFPEAPSGGEPEDRSDKRDDDHEVVLRPGYSGDAGDGLGEAGDRLSTDVKVEHGEQ
ncbi:MAG: hypothetical protein FJW31_04890 [Acidobacteria bacterium]|nr:hypothetical protein [Acidobacteriota bacterium]